jgi:hypothetical protein
MNRKGYGRKRLDVLLVGGEWSASRTSHFTPKERAPGTHSIGWVGPGTGLDDVKKIKSWTFRDSNTVPSAVHPVAIHYTDCTVT